MTLRKRSSGRGVLLCLIGIAALSAGLRVVLVGEVHGPFVFPDELGYERLAQSIGQNGHLALFNQEGLSYSPLYSAVLAPIFTLGASAPVAYHWIKIVNAILMSLAVFPLYKIARFVLPRRLSIVVAALSTVAPLMYYTAFSMSENLAYPLFLTGIWATLIAVRDPGPRTDALLLVSIVVASAVRIQSVVLFPAALTAVVLAVVLERDRVGERGVRSFARAFRQHSLLVGSGAALAAISGALALAGEGVLSVAGRYAIVGRSGIPSPWRVLEVAVENLAGLDLAVGAIPFAGTVVVAYAFVRYGARRDIVIFASVAAPVTAWLLLEVGVNGALFDVPKVHERYFFYVVPLFLITLPAAVRLPASKASHRVYFVAATCVALLPAVIPFGGVINNSIVADSFGLQLFGREVGATIVPIRHATIAAVSVAGTLALTYVLVRHRMRTVIVFVLLVFVVMSGLLRSRVIRAAEGATAVLPQPPDWVDRARPRGDVILVIGRDASALPAWETAFSNLSITHVYSTCNPVFGSEFGEEQVSADRAGHLRDASGEVTASNAVVPAGSGVRGHVVARNHRGGQVLVAPEDGRLIVPPAKLARLSCGERRRH